MQEDDLIRLPYTQDLTRAGIACGLRYLVYSYPQQDESLPDRFRYVMVNMAVELAFRRYLAEHNIPSITTPGITFGSVDETQLFVNGWRCDIRGTLLKQAGLNQQVETKPESLLRTAALIPSDQLAAWTPGVKAVNIFAFVTVHETDGHMNYTRAPDGEDQACWLVILPLRWTGPKSQTPLGKLEVSSEAEDSIKINLGGKDIHGQWASETVKIHINRRYITQNEYATLNYLRTSIVPSHRIRISSCMQPRAQEINPAQWQNYWFDGKEIVLVGFISYPEFSRRARRLSSGSLVWPHPRVRVNHRMLTIGELNPLRNLLEPARTDSA